MQAKCENCFWSCDDHSCEDGEVFCNHADNGCGQVAAHTVCSNWQAKDVKSMICGECLYLRYHQKNKLEAYTCVKNGERCSCTGCVKFWPK